jgi:hypothetical protein
MHPDPTLAQLNMVMSPVFGFSRQAWITSDYLPVSNILVDPMSRQDTYIGCSGASSCLLWTLQSGAI